MQFGEEANSFDVVIENVDAEAAQSSKKSRKNCPLDIDTDSDEEEKDFRL